jgi:membrane-bound metal-dependent hydrolase YbcI (DUF457 family)
MQRTTHLTAGALCALPFALDLPWQAAGGVVLMGLAGSVIPDYFDLRSDARAVLRHRGVSHSLAAALLATVTAYLIVRSLSRVDDPAVSFEPALVEPLTLAFGLGVLSHLALDACTPHGIRPFLPLSGWRSWLLPRSLRIATGSRADDLLGALGTLAIIALVAGRLIAPR